MTGPSWVHKLGAILLGSCLACAKSREPVPDVRASDSTVEARGGTDTGAARREPWRLVAWEPYAGVDPGDYGVGVAFLRTAEDKGARTSVDTLLLRRAPGNADAPIGAMLLTVGPNGVWRYQVGAADSLRPNLLEYGYEESGVPFDSTDASGRWVRGILGFAADGTRLTGWIDTQAAGVGVIRWAEQLADRPIYFARPEQARFFATPDSSTPAPPPRADTEYSMHPLEARGPWLRVRVVQPTDDCVGPDSVRRETRTLWIRYLDDRGRPNVWYYPRGC